MLKLKKIIFISLFSIQTTFAGEPITSLFPLQMLNLKNQDVTITLEQDVGFVFFDEILEDDTLLPAGYYSHTYGVNFAPRDKSFRFKMIFKGEETCVFTVGYFKFPEPPPVTIAETGCDGAGFRVERSGNYDFLVLYVS